jgi:hypothetical protein
MRIANEKELRILGANTRNGKHFVAPFSDERIGTVQ